MIKLIIAFFAALVALIAFDIPAYVATQDFHNRPGSRCTVERIGASVVTTSVPTQETMTLPDGRVVVVNGFYISSHDVGGSLVVYCEVSKEAL